MAEPDPAFAAFAAEAGLLPAGAQAVWTPLTGGVSSDIWRLDANGASYCLKRALPQLKTALEWRAPVERNLYEQRWLQTVGAIAPGAAPKIYGADPARGMFAMAYLPPEQYTLWKSELMAGRADPAAARAVGDLLGRIHAATAHDKNIAARFATDDMFNALRLDPYLRAAAERRSEAADELRALAARTAAVHIALVHGDVSPKNILLGPRLPVFLDSECAWCGDPAFDLAFCLNHLLLKRIPAPQARDALKQSFSALVSAYSAHVDWEPRAACEARAAALLPGLMLARIDGKSPVEYIHSEPEKEMVRAFALARLKQPPHALEHVNADWAQAGETP